MAAATALRVTLRLIQEPTEVRAERLRMLILPSPQHAHGERPSGSASIRTGDWAQVQFYRFGTSTEFVICQSCRVYIGAIEETAAGTHAVPPTGPRRQSTADRRLPNFPRQAPVRRLPGQTRSGKEA